jgi:hypothetical protein
MPIWIGAAEPTIVAIAAVPLASLCRLVLAQP